MSASRTPITPASEPPPPLVPREFRLRLDPLLLLAALGLVVCSIVAINGATADDVAGQPDYYVLRQVALRRRRARADVRRARGWTTRGCASSSTRSTASMIASIVLVFVLGAATTGSKRWIELPFFHFQPSELGKVLLVLALVGVHRRPHAAARAGRRRRG